MKNILNLLILVVAFFALPTFATSQHLAQNYNLRQKSAFTENKGQVADQDGKLRNDVKYLYSAPGLKLVLTSNSFSYEVFTLEKKKKDKEFSEATGLMPSQHLPDKFKETEDLTVHTHRIDVSFVGANPDPEIIAEEKGSDYKNYYLAHTPEEGVTDVYSYSKLIYKNIYPNIDIVWYAKEEGKLKYDIVVHPGGKLEDIKMKYDGMDGLALTEGKLKVKTSQGEIEEQIPFSFLKENNREVQIKHVLNKKVIMFKNRSNYDKQKTLIIDPELIWGTYFGGNSHDYSYGIDIDNYENIYLVGTTISTSGIATSGAHQTTHGGSSKDVFMSKFNIDGNRVWATYYGGSDDDEAAAISVDNINNICIIGKTLSKTGITTDSAHQETYGGGYYDAFITKFNSKGNRLWGSYYGGNETETGRGISVDGIGNIYFTGNTRSDSGIATAGSHQALSGGVDDAFVVKFNGNGVRQWGTYYGGINYDQGNDICNDLAGNIYITGTTGSADFNTVTAPEISSADAHQATLGGYIDAFIVKFNSNGVRQWGTYYGGEFWDEGNSIYTDIKGNVIITGTTGDFYGQSNTGSTVGIATKGAHQDSVAGSYDAFVAKFDSTGVRQWGTYYGGKGNEAGKGISSDVSGNIYLIGNAESDSGIATKGAFQENHGGDYLDAFIVKFNTNGIRQWATYYGGNSWDNGIGVCTNNQNTTYFTGSSRSRNAIATNGAFQDTLGSKYEWDAFLIKFVEYPCNFSPRISGTLLTCPGTIQRYEANSDSSLSYNWTVTDGRIISGQGTGMIEVEWAKTGTGTIKVVVSSLNCKDSVNSFVTIDSFPVADFSFSNTCFGDNTFFTNTSISPSLATYLWNFGDGNSSSLPNPSHKYAIPGNYTVNLKIKNGAGCADSISKTITVHSLPLTSISFTQDSSNKRTYTFSSSANALQYLWSFGDGKSGSGKTVKHTFLTDSTFIVSLLLRDTNGCSAIKDTIISVFTVGINEEQAAAFDLKLYPNPFTNATTLEYQLEETENIRISIYDLAGKEIAVLQNKLHEEGNYRMEIDADKYKLKAGIYMLKILIGENNISKQILKLN